MAGAELFRLVHCGGRWGCPGKVGADLLRAVPDHNQGACRIQRIGRVEHVTHKRPAEQRVQNLGQ
ncbi:hypothetical protein GCM10029963_39180 [Micromonospora andamanensis]